MQITDIISKAEALQKETGINSVTPDRVGSIMVDTLKILNEYQAQSGALAIQKIYTSEAAMFQDAQPVSYLTGRLLKIGQLVVIVPSDPSDSTAGKIYLFAGTDGHKSTWNFVTKIGNFNDLYARVLSNEDAIEEAAVNIANLQTGKANTDGKYPSLTSGFANNLVGRGEATPSEFTFRASGGKSIEDGTARISELRGNGVVWNNDLQLRVANATYEKIGDYSYLATANGTPTTPGSMNYSSGNFFFGKAVANHKYLVSCKYTRKSKRTDIADFTPTNFCVQCGNRGSNYSVNIGESVNINQFITPTEGGDIYVTLNDCIVHIDRPQPTDLTLMFGAGYEPTTIEEFYARIPIGVDMYAYNEGTLIPFNAEGIKSVGFNAWDEQWESGDYNGTTGEKVPDTVVIRSKNLIKVLPNTQYYISVPTSYGATPVRQRFYTENGTYIGYEGQSAKSGIFTTPSNCGYVGLTIHSTTYNNDICIHLVHTGYRNGEYQPYEDFTRQIDSRIKEAFPNGLKPWDKVYNKNGKGYIVKGSGEVDLGSLSYYKESVSTGITCYTTNFKNSGAIMDIPSNIVANILCSRYLTETWADLYAIRKENGVALSGTNLRIVDASYTDAASFKTAMQGVPFWYELADEYKEVIEYDEPFNLDYEVWDFGTEQIVASEPSAPINADIVYQFNAVDTIRNNQLEIEQLKSMIATMQAQMASMVTPANIEEI